MVLIPGFVAVKFLGLEDEDFLQNMIYSFSLSLLINYLLVYHLTIAGIYGPFSLYGICVIESALLVYLFAKKKVDLDGKIVSGACNCLKPWYLNILTFISLALLLLFLYLFFANTGKVFTHWDAVFNWNRWAIDWSQNDIPDLTYLYPQLIPANWSLTYVMMQDSRLQLFAKALMPLFSLYILLIFFSLYIKKKDRTFLLALIIFSAAILTYSFAYINSGYVDIAAAFFSLTAFYSILKNSPDRVDFKKNTMVFLSACGAALTKQAGFIMLAFSVIWLIYALVKNRKYIKPKSIACHIVLAVTIILSTLYWYIVKLIQIGQGKDFSTLKFLLVDIHNDAGYLQRFLNGLDSLKVSPVFFMILAILCLAGIFDRRSRWFTLGITLPAIIAWGLFFSYDDRNIIMAFPFMAYSAARALSFIWLKFSGDKLGIKLRHIMHGKMRPETSQKDHVHEMPEIFHRPARSYFLYCLILIIAVIFSSLSLGGIITRSQLDQQKKIGQPSVNRLLYQYSGENSIDGKILTDYYWATALPGFEGSNGKIFLENDRFVILSNSDSYELVNPNSIADTDIFGFLISDMYYNHPGFKEDFESAISSGRYSEIFSEKGFHFIRINR